MTPTPFLHDEGEETWPVKLHVGCGTIYLDGYTNIDIQGNIGQGAVSTIGDYYAAKDAPDHHHLPARTEIKVDQLGNMGRLPYACGSVDKIVVIQAFEHLPPNQAHPTLVHWWNVLRKDGILILSVPDTEETLRQLEAEGGEEKAFLIRHLMGTFRDPYSLHASWWTIDTLTEALDACGFLVERLPNFHLYPAICLRARKIDLQYSDRRYQSKNDLLPQAILPREGETCLDVGPGSLPFGSATYWVDVVEHPELAVPGQSGVNVESLPFGDKSFDFVYCAHVLEHVAEPVKAIRELRRVGKRGYIEVPTSMLDFLFQQGLGHRWMCAGQSGRGGVLHFMERNPYMFACAGWESMMRSTFQYDYPITEAQIQMRNHLWSWYHKLNVGVWWDADNVPIHVIMTGYAGSEAMKIYG